MDPRVEKPCGDGYHANGQSDSEVWSETPMEPAEARRSRLSFSDTYVEILCVMMLLVTYRWVFIPVVLVVSACTPAPLILWPFQTFPEGLRCGTNASYSAPPLFYIYLYIYFIYILNVIRKVKPD